MNDVYPLKCRIRDAAGVTRVDVYDDIGPGGWFSDGLTAKDFSAQIDGLKGALEVHVNSAGGDVFDGITIGNAIRAHKGPVTTVVDGLAASIASVIAQAGAERVMQPGSMMMIHDAFGVCMGNAAEMAKMAETLNQVSGNLAEIYAGRAGRTPGEWRDAMREETWYTAEEAVAAGLADRVGEEQAQLPAGLNVAALAVPGRIAAALRSLPKAAAPASGPGECCEACGPGCRCMATGAHAARGPRAASVAEQHGHPGRECWDPDGDGDCDLTPEGDTDHDYWTEGGEQKKPVPGKPVDGHLTEGGIRAIVRDEMHVSNAAVDESSWDGPAAMSAAAKASDPAAAFRAICAGEKTTGEPGQEQHWALPHHKHAGDPPNRKGVSSALGYLDRTQDLKNEGAARSHLEAHQRAMGGGAGDHADPLAGMDPAEITKALKEVFE